MGMTNQEAIKRIEEHIAIHKYRESHAMHIVEALDIAISALQAQDLQSTCNNLATDTISRQAAIDALLEEVRLVDGYYVENDEVIDKDDAIEAIRLLPSAQPEPRWIPVSERMPEDGKNCLVSVRCSNNFLVDRGTYSTDLFNVDEEDFFGNRGESGWYYLSSEYGYCKILNVIAWMPEPRPYKEIKDEGFN